MIDEKMIDNSKAQITEYQGAYIIPDEQCLFAFDEKGKFIEYTSKRRLHKKGYATREDIDPKATEWETCDEEVLYIGFLRGHWGHFLVDSTVRMWALSREVSKGKKILAKIEGMESFYRQWFALWGIDLDRDVICPSKPTRFSKVLVPDISYYPRFFLKKEYIEPFRYVSETVSATESFPEVYDKLYLSRSRIARGSKQLGEKYIEELFEKSGYKVLYPEEISFKEQVWYYSHCREMVATTGTVAHNILFAKEGTKLVILNRYPETPGHQDIINYASNAEVVEIPVYVKGCDHDNNLMVLTPELQSFCDKSGIDTSSYDRKKEVISRLLFRIPKAYKLYWK